MAWFVAHAIFLIEPKNGKGQDLTVWENSYLVEAGDFDEAKLKAEKHGAEVEKANDDLKVGDTKAGYTFLGIRKVIARSGSAQEESDDLIDTEEISYSEYRVSSKEDALALVKGGEVSVVYVD